ncbi:hypothetical protein [Thalassobius sp. I31.1]|uniref:hypothetical protein n=1 Tax=Thalassobius sp. I31.1 TaxID=2109912 RepID=UPI001300B2DB|nr:hypothetical protein [Thalassobius sp. I31.1]
MADIEKQLKNVAFGGSWSEERLNDTQRGRALSVVAQAVTECCERDVRTQELHDALDYVRENFGKGPELASSFLQALGEPNPQLRLQGVQRVYRNIVRWSGVAP